jgi:hypothetical protein
MLATMEKRGTVNGCASGFFTAMPRHALRLPSWTVYGLARTPEERRVIRKLIAMLQLDR